jgi:hypothetical protein
MLVQRTLLVMLGLPSPAPGFVLAIVIKAIRNGRIGPGKWPFGDKCGQKSGATGGIWPLKPGKPPVSLLKFLKVHAETLTHGIQGNESTE